MAIVPELTGWQVCCVSQYSAALSLSGNLRQGNIQLFRYNENPLRLKKNCRF